MKNNDHGHDQEEHAYNNSGIMDGPHIISYNISEDKRPGGIKVRYKIRIATGRRAKEIDARQAQVIREVLEWSRQHRQRQQ